MILALLSACVGPPVGGSDDTEGPWGDSGAGDSAGDTGTDDTAPDDTGPIDTDTAAPSIDLDGDGSPEGEDCDDTNPWFHPGAVEWCDLLDQDCDGEPLAPGSCAFEQYAAPMRVARWSTPAPWVESGVFPAWRREKSDYDGDGIDDLLTYCINCVVKDYDANIQVSVLVRGSTTLAAEQVVDLPVDTWFYGGVFDSITQSASPAADIDGDGVADLVFSAGDNDSMLGAVWVVKGPSSRWGPENFVRDRADITWAMAYGDSLFASGGVQGGNLDGDGQTDLLVSARAESDVAEARVYVLPGRGSSGFQELDDEPWVSTHVGGDDFGSTVFVAGDLDGDGSDEVVIRDLSTNRVYLFHGPDLVSAIDGDAEELAAEVWGPGVPNLGCTARVGDLDGDGLEDWIYGDSRYSDVVDYGGALHVMSGVRERAIVLDPADRSLGWWYGTQERGFLGGGACKALDFDGDGRSELAYDYEFARLDRVPVGGEPLEVGLRFAYWDATDPGGRYYMLDSAADLNGDGFDDLLISGNFGDRNGFVLVPGWDVPWDEAEWW